jgi:hypothetical protein
MNKFYPEYEQKDPYAVMNWLFNKATEYQNTLECRQVSDYLNQLEYAYQESDEYEDDYSDEGEINYNSFDDVMKREDYEWKKFNFNKKSRRASVKSNSPVQVENTLTDRKLSLKLKKKSSMVVNKKVYKDIEIP